MQYFLSPIVDMNVVLKASSENRNKMQVLPTPESPINNNLKSKSYDFFAMVSLYHTDTVGTRNR